MTQLSREELDAKLETIEARMDGRVAAIESKIDGLVSVLDLRFKAGDERMGRIESSMAETTSYVRTLKNTIFGTAVAGVLGVAGLNYTLLSNMVAAFESGKSSATTQADVKRQTEETAALLRQMQKQMEASNPTQPAGQK